MEADDKRKRKEKQAEQMSKENNVEGRKRK